jgi:hypothetical protein
MKKTVDRRTFLKTLAWSGIGVIAGSVFKQSPANALDLCDKVGKTAPAAMMVTALKYVPESKKPGQKCSNCIQFKSDATDKKLGQCNILQNCSVQSAGWCASWSKKA